MRALALVVAFAALVPAMAQAGTKPDRHAVKPHDAMSRHAKPATDAMAKDAMARDAMKTDGMKTGAMSADAMSADAMKNDAKPH